MHRRTSLKVIAAMTALSGQATAAAKPPIQLHVDLDVDPHKEKALLDTFQQTFKPAIIRQPGFVDVQLLKMRTALMGAAPTLLGYRLLISFETEEQRLKWVATETHQKVWPQMEANFAGKKLVNVLLFDPK